MIVSELAAHKMASVPLGATTPAQITEFSTGTAQPFQAVLGPDGAIWFAEIIGGKVGRIATDGTLLEFTLPTAGAQSPASRPVPTAPFGLPKITRPRSARFNSI